MKEENKRIEIYVEPDKFILKNDCYLVELDKNSNDNIDLEQYHFKTHPFYCYGIVGCLQANKRYLVCIDEVVKKGEYLGDNIYLIKKFNYIPYEADLIPSEDYKYITMINDFLGRNLLYFGEKVDLTMSFKYNKTLLDEFNNKDNSRHWTNIFSLSNMKFCWNSHLANVFIRNTSDNLNKFIFPIINGFFGVCSGEEYSGDLILALIARKDIRRSGMRFLIRGADKNGLVANSVEIEEILISKHSEKTIINSYLQIRGSVPLIWTQEPNMTRNPKMAIHINPEDNYNAFSFHMNELISDYGTIHCINLIDKKKDQLKLGKVYQRLCNDYKSKHSKTGKDLEYSWFDFHHECKKMQYGNIKKLFLQESVSKNLEESKYTSIQIEQKKYQDMLKDTERTILDYFTDPNFLNYVQLQKVVFRNNCVDSLDRTNVVQSVFGRYFLHLMLKDLGLSDVSPSKDNISIEFRGNFESKFKNLWADNGDNLSFTYSGTGAMKSDFVRTGKRTWMGNLRDGYLTMKRLYINNLMDGYNQDCHDYFLGNLNIKKDKLKSHSLFGVVVLHLIALFVWVIMSRNVRYIDFGFDWPIINWGVWLVGTIVIIWGTAIILRTNFIDLHTNHK